MTDRKAIETIKIAIAEVEWEYPMEYAVAFDRAISALEERQGRKKGAGWISVEDRLPETKGTYLVYAPTYSGGSSSSLDCINGVMFSRWGKHWSIEVGYHKRPNCVKYWMTLPKPPKEGEHGQAD